MVWFERADDHLQGRQQLFERSEYSRPLSAEELRRTKAKAQQMQETTLGDSMTRGVQSKGTGRIRLCMDLDPFEII